MLLKLALSALALAGAGMAANAADLPARSKIGEIFAERPKARHAAYRESEPFVAIFPRVRNSPEVRGYYGQSGDFYYSSYYGTPSNVIFGRLPYVCSIFGTCAGWN